MEDAGGLGDLHHGRALRLALKSFVAQLNHQSLPSVSPPLGVTVAQNVSSDMPGARVRTLPSAKPVSIPPTCGVCGMRGSQSLMAGRSWKVKPRTDPTLFGGLPLVIGQTSVNRSGFPG
jgi:hypothetical protein